MRCTGVIGKAIKRSIVTLFLQTHDPIAAAPPGDFLTQAAVGTAVSICKIPVIAFLGWLQGAVAADRS